MNGVRDVEEIDIGQRWICCLDRSRTGLVQGRVLYVGTVAGSMEQLTEDDGWSCLMSRVEFQWPSGTWAILPGSRRWSLEDFHLQIPIEDVE